MVQQWTYRQVLHRSTKVGSLSTLNTLMDQRFYLGVQAEDRVLNFKGDVSSGSWYFKSMSNTRFAIACATQYERTDWCISTPTDSTKPVLLNCDANDESQRFQGIQVRNL
jgi:hypothetical protein